MNKDALLATIIGFGIGLVIAALVFLAPNVIRSFPRVRIPDISSILRTIKQQQPIVPTPSPKQSETLTIQSPLPDTIEPNNETLVSGTALTGSVVVIEGETGESVTVVNGDGAFAGKIALTEGKNDIVVTSHTKDTVQTQTIRVFYTPENF